MCLGLGFRGDGCASNLLLTFSLYLIGWQFLLETIPGAASVWDRERDDSAACMCCLECSSIKLFVRFSLCGKVSFVFMGLSMSVLFPEEESETELPQMSQCLV